MPFCPLDRTVGNKVVRKAAEPGLPDRGVQIRSTKTWTHTKLKTKQFPALRFESIHGHAPLASDA